MDAHFSQHGIETTPTGVIIRVYVAPRSSANKVIGVHNGEIKVALTAPPVEGAANRALIVFMAKALDVPRSSVTLQSGETSRHKVLRVEGIDADATLRLLAI